MKKSIIHKLSPFNNYSDMPAALLAVKKMLAFFICYVIGMILGNSLIMGILFASGKDPTQGEAFSERVMEMLGLYGVAAIIAVSILYWKLIEKRKLSEMGVTKNISGWFIGAGMGILLIIAAVSAIMVTGTIEFTGFSTDLNITMLLLMLGGYTVQGAAEEFLCRGLVLGALRDKVALPVAVGANTLVFIIPHMGTLADAEPMFVILGVANLAAISCLFSFITLRTGSVWAACGLHSLWNFTLECVCGLTVSGSETASPSLINMKASGENLLNGGKYGIEASIITIIIFAAAAIFCIINKKGRGTVNGIQ